MRDLVKRSLPDHQHLIQTSNRCLVFSKFGRNVVQPLGAHGLRGETGMFKGSRRIACLLLSMMLGAAPVLACDVPTGVADMQAELLSQLNAERRAAGLSPLKLSTKLDKAAQSHACDNASRKSYSHEGSDGSTLKTRLKRVGYSIRIAAENTGRGFGTPDRVVTFWMGSEKHRSNILLRKAREVGIGIALSDAPDSKVHWILVVAAGR